MISLKCTVVGDTGVGKTSLIVAHCSGTGEPYVTPVVFSNHYTKIMMDNISYDLTIYDTAGSEEYDQLRPLSYPGTDVFILCFSVVSPTSFENIVGKWCHEITVNCPETPFILVGTKLDLTRDNNIIRSLDKEGFSSISKEAGIERAKEIGASKYVECSARTGEGLYQVFDEAVKAAIVAQGHTQQTNNSDQSYCSIL